MDEHEFWVRFCEKLDDREPALVAELTGHFREPLVAFRQELHDYFQAISKAPLPDHWRADLDRFLNLPRGVIMRPPQQRFCAWLVECDAREYGRLPGGPVPGYAEWRRQLGPAGLQVNYNTTAAPKAEPLPAQPQATQPQMAEQRAAELDKQRRAFARSIAKYEQERLGLTDEERQHYERFVYENFLREVRGEALLSQPEYWLDKNLVYHQKICARNEANLRLPSIGGITAEQYERSERNWILENSALVSWDLGERALLESAAARKNEYYAGWGPVARAIDSFINPAWEGTGNLNDVLNIAGPFAGANYFGQGPRRTSGSPAASTPRPPKPTRGAKPKSMPSAALTQEPAQPQKSVEPNAEGASQSKSVHGNSREYVGDTHVYSIRGPNGTLKIGQSMQGVRVGDGASIRGEAQTRKLIKHTGEYHESDIRRTLPDKATGLDYEKRLIERFRRIYGPDSLPGNKTNR